MRDKHLSGKKGRQRRNILRRAFMSIACSVMVMNGAFAVDTNSAGYPNGPIRLVVPFPPGGSVDTIARTIGPQLKEQLGQPVIIENRPGASSGIGAQYVKNAPADGYTILLNASLQVVNPMLLLTVKYDPINDFAPITEIGLQPQLLVVSSESPYKTLQELLNAAKKRPRELQWAIAAFGSAGHLATELLNLQAKVEMPIIPYKGGGPALIDLMGGHVTAMIEPMASAFPHVQAGKLRALAVTSDRKIASLPDLPTVSEAGLPGFDMPSWYGVWAPAGTPKPIVDRLSREIQKAAQTPSVARKLAGISFIPVRSSPEELNSFQAKELSKYKTLIKDANIKAN